VENDRKAEPDVKAQVFALVEAVVEARPFHPSTLAEKAKVELDVADRRSNPYFVVWEGEGTEGSLVARAEVRVPTGKGPSKDGLVVLKLSATAGSAVVERDVFAKWGDGPEVRPPNPTGPADLPVHYLYRLPWGTLSFGFSRDEPAHLVEVVLDATGAR